MVSSLAKQLVDCGMEKSWAQEIARQIVERDPSGPKLIDAGVPTFLAILLANEIEDARQPMLAGRSLGRFERFLSLDIPEKQSRVLADAINATQLKLAS